MSRPPFLSTLTPNRKLALRVAVVTWCAWAFWTMFRGTRIDPLLWTSLETVLFTLGGGLASSVAIVELVRFAVPRFADWRDRQHFVCVAGVFVVLAALQLIALRMMVKSYGG
jgi:ABC-type arginine/histidine transport system permease subunit